MKKKEIKRIAIIVIIAVLGTVFLLWQMDYNSDKVKISMLNVSYKESCEVIGDKANINKAAASTLASLDGIGEKTAQSIVEYRMENGDFKSIEEIKNVKGIGDKTFEEIKENICVE